MIRARVPALLAAAALMVSLAGCASEGTDPGTSPTPTSTLSAADRADAALLPYEEIEPVAPGTVSDSTGTYTAEADLISAPWGQFTHCSRVGRPMTPSPA
jgi:poly(3-hydroxybutyrate) depolymerase